MTQQIASSDPRPLAYRTPGNDDVSRPVEPNTPLLEVRNLRTWFPIRRGVFSSTVGHVKAVDGVSFNVKPGKTLGLVGESGCGKTTVGRTILRLIPKTSGEVRYKGEDFYAYRGEALRRLRRQMQIVFQDPVSSLNPRMTVGNIIGEPIEVHGIARGQEKRERVASLLQRVGLDPTYASRYPHEFSGGQRQRIGIARALALNPDFIVCDEPVSALDVSIQSQILNLLDDLQKERNIAYLFIAHNLAVVEHFSDDVAVMYLGKIVEQSPSRELYANPKHPYTTSLLSAVPEPNPRPKKHRIVLPGEVPSPSNPPTGCAFHPRCPLTRQCAAQAGEHETVNITSSGKPVRVMQKCVEQVPTLEPKRGSPGHVAACWFSE
ncbi:MAG TPA: oligopeptide/dipeptide ABC transporter ATP-binding protein [Tepidisphaeraceae bacterium]|jgi:oligopeptide/dipeptide ABC transporter ATP-binding protein|nr:oligopeptide/dipeptide ABC transporter ATP-binding protein [Tepidisphaeraceae bacterium]